MTKLALLSSGLIAAAIIATPALAREHHARQTAPDRYVTDTYPGYYAGNAYDAYAGPTYYYGGYSCAPAPRVGAFATAPWTTGYAPCQPYYMGY